ncbi:Peroxisomal membrane protein, partial [Lachnellula subtilissima]
MPTDRLLTTVLRAYQGAPDPEQINRIFSSTASLFTTLSNPLNITLLTSQLLISPAIWNQVDGLRTSLRVISVYNTAAITVHKNQLEGGSKSNKPFDAYQPRIGGGVGCDEWATAVVKGLDDRSPRWEHTLVLAGILLGMEGQERRGLSRGLRAKLETALVTAANLTLQDQAVTGILGVESMILALNHAFPLLSDHVRRLLDYDALVLPLIKAMTYMEGYQDAIFLEAVDYDVRQVSGNKFDWSAKSPSFLQLQNLGSKPLVSSMGPLSRLIAHAIENLSIPSRALETLDHLVAFSGKLLTAWQRNKLSEIDPSEEATFLTPETLRVTFPLLWQVLKTAMFATVLILRSVIAKTLITPYLSSNELAPCIASKALTALSNIHFISSRMGSNAFSAYTFVNLTSIDILSRFPMQSGDFLRSILPSHAGQIPAHPLHRNHDLFYLNTVEHFTLIMSPATTESLILTPASPYLNPTANAHLLEIFEAAHSAMLSSLAAPQNGPLAAKSLPFYVESLFNSFPTNLSPRQFRFAFKALMQITSPPNQLAASEPMLAETLLEMLHHRALHAPTAPLPPSVTKGEGAEPDSQTAALSEQAVLLLTLLDALPYLPLGVLEEWFPLAADLLNALPDAGMRERCRARFWEVLESGEMDVERSAV